MHPFQLPPICLWWTPGWGQPAQPKGKLTVLSGTLNATSVHMGTSFVCIGGSYTQVHMLPTKGKFCTWCCNNIPWGVLISKLNRLSIASSSSISVPNRQWCSDVVSEQVRREVIWWSELPHTVTYSFNAIYLRSRWSARMRVHQVFYLLLLSSLVWI